MNLIKKLFGGSKSELNKPIVSNICNQYDSHQQLLVEEVIEMLKTNPECFSARWFTGLSLDRSVKCKDKQILIMIDDGQIIRPIQPRMSKKQKEIVRQLIEPIVKKDSDYIIENLVSNCQ
jgi:hypothetical protein